MFIQGNSWPEQDAIDEWWQKHSLELKKATTEYRLTLQEVNMELLGACEEALEYAHTFGPKGMAERLRIAINKAKGSVNNETAISHDNKR